MFINSPKVKFFLYTVQKHREKISQKSKYFVLVHLNGVFSLYTAKEHRGELLMKSNCSALSPSSSPLPSPHSLPPSFPLTLSGYNVSTFVTLFSLSTGLLYQGLSTLHMCSTLALTRASTLKKCQSVVNPSILAVCHISRTLYIAIVLYYYYNTQGCIQC